MTHYMFPALILGVGNVFFSLFSLFSVQVFLYLTRYKLLSHIHDDFDPIVAANYPLSHFSSGAKAGKNENPTTHLWV